MEPKFKIGDLVILKTGSPKMEIIQILFTTIVIENFKGFKDVFEGNYRCFWTVVGEEKTEIYSESSLTAAL